MLDVDAVPSVAREPTAATEPTSSIWIVDAHHHDRTCYWDVDECRWSCHAQNFRSAVQDG